MLTSAEIKCKMLKQCLILVINTYMIDGCMGYRSSTDLKLGKGTSRIAGLLESQISFG